MPRREAVSARQELRPTLIRLPPELHEAIKAKAAREERSMAQAVRHALRLYLEGPALARPE